MKRSFNKLIIISMVVLIVLGTVANLNPLEVIASNIFSSTQQGGVEKVIDFSHLKVGDRIDLSKTGEDFLSSKEYSNYEEALFSIIIDGKEVVFTEALGKPKIVNDRTMVPIRIISENMGYKVDWNGDTKTAIITNVGAKVEISIGKSYALVNGTKTPIDIQDGKEVDTQAYIEKDRTMVPLRFISQAFGANVEYKKVDKKHIVTITTKVPAKTDSYGGITFNKDIDVLADGSGRMSEEKTIEFLSKVIENSKMYTENGKHYFKYDKVEVPEGFRVGLGVQIMQIVGSPVDGIFLSANPYFNLEENTIPRNQSFIRELRNDALKNSDLILFSIAIIKEEHTGSGDSAVVCYQINYNPITGFAENIIDISSDRGSSGGIVPFNSDLVFKDLKIKR